MREETREREPHHQPERKDHTEGLGREPSQAKQWDVLRTLGEQPAGLLSPGGTRWEITGLEPTEPTLFTQRQDGSQRAAYRLTRKQFTTLWANPERHIKGWRRTDAPADVHHKARRALADAERKRRKRAEDPTYREAEKIRVAEWIRRKRAEDPTFREVENSRSAERRRKKRAEDPVYREAENSRSAERRRKKRAEDPAFREAEKIRSAERYRKKRAEDPVYREVEKIRNAEWRRRKRAENPVSREAGRNSPQSDHPVAPSPKALSTSETLAFKRDIPDLNLPAPSPSEEEQRRHLEEQ